MYIYIYMCVCIYIYIYFFFFTEREREPTVHIIRYIHIYIYILLCVYIYIHTHETIRVFLRTCDFYVKRIYLFHSDGKLFFYSIPGKWSGTSGYPMRELALEVTSYKCPLASSESLNPGHPL